MAGNLSDTKLKLAIVGCVFVFVIVYILVETAPKAGNPTMSIEEFASKGTFLPEGTDVLVISPKRWKFDFPELSSFKTSSICKQF